MKIKLVIAILILLCSNSIYSQNLQKLDEKNGFKGLVLGTSLDKIKKDIKLKEISNNKREQLSYFTIKDPSNYTILDVQPAYVKLIFFKKELMEIIIRMPDQHSLNADNKTNNAFGTLGTSIVRNLAVNYGTINVADENPIEPTVSFTIKWTGNLVTLIYCDYKPKTDERGIIDTGESLHFISNRLYKQHSTLIGNGSSDF